MPDSAPLAVSRSFSSLIPAAIILTIVFLINIIFEYTPYTTVFNINELVIFGIPIVLNPIMMISFILVFIVLCVITYIAMSLGLVPLLQGIEIP